MNESSLLTVVIPCYNEAINIPVVIPKILEHCRSRNYRLIVVDDGSGDGSGALLQPFVGETMTLLRHKVNRGYGGALKTGLSAATTPWAITVDSDGQHRMEDVDRLFAFAQEKGADLVIGQRPVLSSGLYRSLGKRLILLFSHLLLKHSIRDLNSGMKLYHLEEARPYLPLCPDSMAFSDVIALLMLCDRHLVLEVPIEVASRVSGKSTIGIHTAVDTLNEILNISMLICPQKIFTGVAFLLFVTGVGWGIYTFCRSGVITSAVTLLLLGTGIAFSLGLLGEQLARISRRLHRRK